MKETGADAADPAASAFFRAFSPADPHTIYFFFHEKKFFPTFCAASSEKWDSGTRALISRRGGAERQEKSGNFLLAFLFFAPYNSDRSGGKWWKVKQNPTNSTAEEGTA